ncbi:hypothetical protein BK025_09015 [Sodalis sp. TME1]|nr:hypothetical protein BK025_09015 [Sodalis sp. TME1]
MEITLKKDDLIIFTQLQALEQIVGFIIGIMPSDSRAKMVQFISHLESAQWDYVNIDGLSEEDFKELKRAHQSVYERVLEQLNYAPSEESDKAL